MTLIIKKGRGRFGRALNKTLRERGGRFKLAGNSRVSLLEAMNSMAELLSAQVENFTDKTDDHDSGVKSYATF
ncbi:hypothetical protein Golax_010090 [Gossypium laxum]|uniref:Uncharacterized protein n=1 Tax=Gossypium laxum TaxID=34288 RepID=A0A7J8ZHT5_9ROSI|nr:hypothetical protein [Gossypium laxum]